MTASFFFTGEAAVEKAEFSFGKTSLERRWYFLDRGFEFEFRFFDHGIDDVSLMAACTSRRRDSQTPGRWGSEVRRVWMGVRPGGSSSRTENVEVAVESERERSRDGRGGKDEHVGRVAVRGRLCP